MAGMVAMETTELVRQAFHRFTRFDVRPLKMPGASGRRWRNQDTANYNEAEPRRDKSDQHGAREDCKNMSDRRPRHALRSFGYRPGEDFRSSTL
jgi:hypothetical protein